MFLLNRTKMLKMQDNLNVCDSFHALTVFEIREDVRNRDTRFSYCFDRNRIFLPRLVFVLAKPDEMYEDV